MAGTFASYIDAFYFSDNSIKNNTKFQRKRGGRGPLYPPLNLPLIKLFFKLNLNLDYYKRTLKQITVTSINLSLSAVLETPAEYVFF